MRAIIVLPSLIFTLKNNRCFSLGPNNGVRVPAKIIASINQMLDEKGYLQYGVRWDDIDQKTQFVHDLQNAARNA